LDVKVERVRAAIVLIGQNRPLESEHEQSNRRIVGKMTFAKAVAQIIAVVKAVPLGSLPDAGLGLLLLLRSVKRNIPPGNRPQRLAFERD
jgi:hypothetical protein